MSDDIGIWIGSLEDAAFSRLKIPLAFNGSGDPKKEKNAMRGLMQNHQLLISSLIEHVANAHPNAEIVSRTLEGSIHRCTYADVERRAKQVARALTAMGVTQGERICTLAWNGFRHLEMHFGVSGFGAVLHTAIPRLFPEQLKYIINHAEDQLLFFDSCFPPLIEKLAPKLKSVKAYIVLTDRQNVPCTSLSQLLCYEELIAARSGSYRWPDSDENTASSLCYTSGTTGIPKGVMYTHRSTLLHSMLICMTDGFALSAVDSVCLAIPMFHVNAWGLPYSAAMVGARLLLPGPTLDGASLYRFMRDERATAALGVPTIWLQVQQYVQAQSLDPVNELSLKRVLIGGAAVPRSVVETFERRFGLHVLHAWGMTETSPIGPLCNPLQKHQLATEAQRIELQSKQGRVPYGVSLKITDEAGAALPHDGMAAGRPLVRGHWVASAYFGLGDESILDADGWFDTGDIATTDPDGYMRIADRAKDVIKSGDEWISSIDLENAAMGHAALAEAAAIGLPHPKWQERPLLVVAARWHRVRFATSTHRNGQAAKSDASGNLQGISIRSRRIATQETGYSP
ncbi:MAG TPA: AMP-binding protein [Steroidobacteraceae bacterium]